MKARDIVGKTVARVVQQCSRTNYGKVVYDVKARVCTDGTRLVFPVDCAEDEYLVDTIVVMPQ